MAVTQQLACLSEADLIKCLHNQSSLESLLNFTLLSGYQYLDLNWEITYLKALIREYHYGSLISYSEAVDGIHNLPDSLGEQDVEEQPAYNRFNDVEKIISGLNEIDIDNLLSKLPPSLDQINKLLGSHYDDLPYKHLSDTFRQLTGFYRTAEKKKYCVVCWWD